MIKFELHTSRGIFSLVHNGEKSDLMAKCFKPDALENCAIFKTQLGDEIVIPKYLLIESVVRFE